MIGFAELKAATREAIGECKGIEGAAATAGRANSTAGLWNNLHKTDLPTIECALALDEISVAKGLAPPITATMARLLGMVVIAPPIVEPTRAGWLARMGELATVSGELHSEFCTALADGRVCDRDRADLRAEVRRVQTELAAIDAALAQGGE
jgi:hypothetical protein